MATFEDDGTSGWLYLSASGTSAPIADAWVYNRVPPPAVSKVGWYRPGPPRRQRVTPAQTPCAHPGSVPVVADLVTGRRIRCGVAGRGRPGLDRPSQPTGLQSLPGPPGAMGSRVGRGPISRGDGDYSLTSRSGGPAPPRRFVLPSTVDSAGWSAELMCQASAQTDTHAHTRNHHHLPHSPASSSMSSVTSCFVALPELPCERFAIFALVILPGM